MTSPLSKPTPDLQLMVRPALNVFYIGMNNTFAPFDIKEVRQAVAMGIDRQRIVDTFYPAGSEAATYFTPCAIPNGCVGDEWYTFDPAAGKALLATAGFPDGFKTKLFYRDVVRGYLPEVARVAEEIQAQLKANLNIDAEIVVMESGAFIEAANAGTLDGFHLLGWGADYPHITNFLDFHFSGNKLQFGNPFPEIYETLAEAAQIADPAAAEPLYVTANNAIRDLVPDDPGGARWFGDGLPRRRGQSAGQPADERDVQRDCTGRSHDLRLDAERRADQPVLPG